MNIKIKQRISLSVFFFLTGVFFSSWTARIPEIKLNFELNEAQLGSILFVMPVSSILSLPFSGWLVNKFDSRWPLLIAAIFQCGFLLLIGFSGSIIWLTGALFLFAFASRIIGVAINTQAINLQKQFINNINGSFHALWSVGGIAGVGFTTLMIKIGITMQTHFIVVSTSAFLLIAIFFSNLLKKDKDTSNTKLMLRKPEPLILKLGILILFAAICEGGMFDWSGIYFRDIVGVQLFTTGYFVFMTSMAISRFSSDWFINIFGMPKMFIISALLITIGLLISVIFPYYWPAMFGFCLVGMGTAAVVPMTLSLASKSKKYSVGVAIALIATFGMFGILIGPPMIGYFAHALNLRASFLIVALSALFIIPISVQVFKGFDKSQV